MSTSSYSLLELLMMQHPEYYLGYGDPGEPLPAPTTVYRMQYPDGRGPFGSVVDGMSLMETIEPYICPVAWLNHESFSFTSGTFYHTHGDAAYGFESLQWLGRWFSTPARQIMAERGIQLVAFDLHEGEPLLRVGNGEIVFSRRNALPASTLDLITLA